MVDAKGQQSAHQVTKFNGFGFPWGAALPQSIVYSQIFSHPSLAVKSPPVGLPATSKTESLQTKDQKIKK